MTNDKTFEASPVYARSGRLLNLAREQLIAALITCCKQIKLSRQVYGIMHGQLRLGIMRSAQCLSRNGLLVLPRPGGFRSFQAKPEGRLLTACPGGQLNLNSSDFKSNRTSQPAL